MSTPSSVELPQDAEQLRELVIGLRSTVDEQAERIAQLEEWVRLLRSQRFGRSSEKLSVDQLGLFNEAEQAVDADEATPETSEADDTIEVPGHRRAKPGRRPLPAWMERVEIVHDLPEDQKVCSEHGDPLVELGRDVSEQLEIIPAQVRVIRHVRPKYVCSKCRDHVKTAPAPPALIPKSLASPALLAYVAVSKYADGLPLYRQEAMLQRGGVDLSRATLAHWMVRFGEAVQPLIERMRRDLVAYDVVQCDETTFPVLNEPGKSPTSQAYLWVQRGGARDRPLILYAYDPSRSKDVPQRLLAGFQGFLQTDGYEGYTEIGARPGIVHVGCFAHARRKFVEALAGGKGVKKAQQAVKRSSKVSRARQALLYIQELYAIERSVAEATPEKRHRVRQEKSRPVLEKLRVWLDGALGSVPEQSLTGKALSYLDRQWIKLVRYTEDGRIPIDTNAVENAIRPFVVGRKNWLFADTARGAQASANLYSLIQTAQANGIEPFTYLRHVAAELPRSDKPEDLEALLPHRIALETLRGDDNPR